MGKIDLTRIVTAEEKAARALETARREAARALDAAYEDSARAITGPVPRTEQLSWAVKAAAAQALAAGTATPQDRAMIAAEAAAAGETPEDLAGRILARAEAYRLAVASLTGARRAAARQIAAAADPEAARTAGAAGIAALAAARDQRA